MLKFEIAGSSGNIYEISVSRDGPRFRMTCTCEAAKQGSHCKHRFALLDGEISAINSPNTDDVSLIQSLFKETTAQKHYEEIRLIENQITQLKLELKKHKRAIAREMGP